MLIREGIFSAAVVSIISIVWCEGDVIHNRFLTYFMS